MKHGILSFIFLFFLFSCVEKSAYMNLSSGRKVQKEMLPVKNILEAHAEKWFEGQIFSMQNALTQNAEGKVQSLYQLIISHEIMDIPKARILLVESVNDLLKQTETELFDQPFSAKNVHISILFHNEKGQLVQGEGSLSKLVLRDGVLRYYEKGQKQNQHFKNSAFYQQTKTEKTLQLVEQELFDEANEMVQQQRYLSNYFSKPEM